MNIGIGIRSAHYGAWFDAIRGATDAIDGVDTFEFVTENLLGRGGMPLHIARAAAERGTLFLHGLSLSIGGTDPLPHPYLKELRSLAEELGAGVVSDHLCFGSATHVHGHDLWPIPLDDASFQRCVLRIEEAQEALGRKIVLENVSSYLRLKSDGRGEAEFLRDLCEATGCQVLLDVNNIHVAATNHGFDARAYVDHFSVGHIGYMHVADHSERDGYLFDDHCGPPRADVLALLRRAVGRFPQVPVIFEWDENVPELDEYVRASRAISEAVQGLSDG